MLYSSASDIWNTDNKAYGFERMHTWLALAHAQIPVDVVHESELARKGLDGYKVAYLSDPNISRAAAQNLAEWVNNGGTLVMTAGAGERDEYNRPLNSVNDLLPYSRSAVQTLQVKGYGGRSLTMLKPFGEVTSGKTKIDILSVKQMFTNLGSNTQVKSTFDDGSPAEISAPAGRGRVISKGYLPAIDYMRKALGNTESVADVLKKVDDNDDVPGQDVAARLGSEQSYNPSNYPAAIREAIIAPVQTANVETPIKCNVPLVDAVYMTGGKDLLIPLANYTLKPIKKLTLEIAVDKPVRGVKSVYQKIIKFEKLGNNRIRINMPLECTDFVTVEY